MKNSALNMGKVRRFLKLNLFSLSLFLISVFVMITYGYQRTAMVNRNAMPNLTLEKKEEICSFVFFCGHGDINTLNELRPLLISAIILSTCPLRFVLITDAATANQARLLFTNDINVSPIQIFVDIWTVDVEKILRWTRKLKLGFDKNLGKKGPWLIAKLYMPFIVKYLDKAIILDSDMVFLEDPAMLWDQFHDGKPWTFKLPLKDLTSASRICSCVILMKIRSVMENKIYPEKLMHALQVHGRSLYDPEDGVYHPKHADQGVYFILRLTYPELFESLDRRYNVDHCHFYYGAFNRSVRPNSRQKVSLLHKNCGVSPLHLQYAEPFFQSFRSYQPHWIRNGISKKIFKPQIRSFRL